MIVKTARFLLYAVIILLFLPFLLVPLAGFVNFPSTLMLKHWIKGESVERQWVPLSDIAPALQHSVLASEDARFCTHQGIDWEALQQQVETALEGEPSRGASTITMQLVKNLFLWHGRSYVRKMIEIPLALWADLILTKPRILTLYLNTAEWGPGVFGVEAASRHYFNRSARQLTPLQAARLATTLPNPHQRHASRPGPYQRSLTAINMKRSRAMPAYLDCLP
jgi:monofunctional biosynthetic peptidoglycan transglycosylase